MTCFLETTTTTTDVDDNNINYIAELHINRDYELFGLLGGVRKSGNIYEPKGLPENCSWMVGYRAKEDQEYSHTHSWLTLEELKNIQNKQPNIIQLKTIIGIMEGIEKVNKKVKTRIVFYFDS